MEKLSRGYRLFDATSQWLNVLVFNGEANYSMSGDAYRYKRTWFMRLVNFLFSWMEKEHCRLAYEADIQRAKNLLKEANQSV